MSAENISYDLKRFAGIKRDYTPEEVERLRGSIKIEYSMCKHQSQKLWKLLNTENCSCNDYINRKDIVPDCVKLTPSNLSQLNWMPETCAYKLVNEGKDIPEWHPLNQEYEDNTLNKKYSVAQKVTSENDINMDKITDYIYDWDKEV